MLNDHSYILSLVFSFKQCPNLHQWPCKKFKKMGKCPKKEKCNFFHQLNDRTLKKKNIKAKIVNTKYKKINNVNAKNKPAKNADKQTNSSSISNCFKSSDNNMSRLDELLQKRLKSPTVIKPISTNSNEELGSYIKLSTDGESAFNVNIENKSTLSRKSLVNSDKKKYFTLDDDDDIFSHLTLQYKPDSCRPQLKIIPDFLLNDSS